MEKTNFKKMLFDIACSAVACDGHIDEREIKELQRIEKSTAYFKDINLSRKLEVFVERFKDNPENTIEGVLNKLKASILNPVEEMLILEIVLRLIYADVKIDEKEIYSHRGKAIRSIMDTLIPHLEKLNKTTKKEIA